jgi:hypothetical protein
MMWRWRRVKGYCEVKETGNGRRFVSAEWEYYILTGIGGRC